MKGTIMSTFKSKCLSINPLKFHKNNARTRSRKQIKKLAESIKEFGFANQILIDEHNMVLAGHGRLLAAKEMGMSEVPCIRLDHMTEVQKRAHKTGRREYLCEIDPLYCGCIIKRYEGFANDEAIKITSGINKTPLISQAAE